MKAVPGNPYDGHTLATVLPEIEAQIGAPLGEGLSLLEIVVGMHPA